MDRVPCSDPGQGGWGGSRVRWGYPVLLLVGVPHLPFPLWTDKQRENITFPRTSYVGGNNILNPARK